MEIAKDDIKKIQVFFFGLFILEYQIDLDVENTLLFLLLSFLLPSLAVSIRVNKVFLPLLSNLVPSLYFRLHLLHNNFSDSSPIYFMYYSCAQTHHMSAHLLAVFTVVP